MMAPDGLGLLPNQGSSAPFLWGGGDAARHAEG